MWTCEVILFIYLLYNYPLDFYKLLEIFILFLIFTNWLLVIIWLEQIFWYQFIYVNVQINITLVCNGWCQGCDASVLLDGSASGPSEKNAPPNLTLRAKAFQIIEELRRLVQNQCGRIVSCADITALAARDAVVLVITKQISQYLSVYLHTKKKKTRF